MPTRSRRLARLIASGLGSGYSPKAPGTAGSLLALALGAGLMTLSPWALPMAVAASILLGLASIGPAGGREDPGWVVIDEFAGQWIAMLALSHPSLPGLALAFALFRLFDIAKPGPIGWADRQGGAVGVMLDDVIAGAIAAVLLLALRAAVPGLV
ncbi:MAG: phosphatidylglycerophosphatase A [Acetobacteraceae bacterium]|nr:phosphatidylglycerophosphatase A [Acetobacteraceae bacterium]